MEQDTALTFGERIRLLFSSSDPVSVVALVALVMGIGLLLVISRRRTEWILLAVIASSALVGSTSGIVDTSAALVRWFGIGVLLLTLFHKRSRWFFGMSFFLVYATFGVLFLLNSPDFQYQFQRALLLIVTAISIPSALSLIAKDEASIARFFKEVGTIGSLIAILAATTVPGHIGTAERFAAYTTGAPHFAMVMGLLLPFIFFAYQHEQKRFMKSYYMITFAIGGVCLLLSAERTGTIAGFIALVPMLLGLGMVQKMRAALLIVTGVLILLFASAELGFQSVEYITGRYHLDAGLTKRDVIWQESWTKVTDQLFLGRGTGANDISPHMTFHNSYLEAWFNTGLFGALCFAAAQIRAIFVASRLIRGRSTMRKEAALSLGIVLGIVFICFFESMPAGASSNGIILFLVSISMLEAAYRTSKRSLTNGLDVKWETRVTPAYSPSGAEVQL